MSLYARPSARLVRQISADVFVLVWAVAWVLVGRLLHRMVAAVAGPARQVEQTSTQMSHDMTDAADQASRVPGLGGELRQPFDAAAANLADLARSARDQAITIEHVALVAGIVVAAIPILVLVSFWLPRRLRFARESNAARVFCDSAADLDLFALRAMAAQPLPVLARISGDPVSAWRSGDRRVIAALAELELRKSGLPLPEEFLPRAETGR